MSDLVTVTGATVDDLLNDALQAVIVQGERADPTKGQTLELFGCTLRLSNPLARLSRSAMRGIATSPIGELAWYLAGSNDVDFISHYIPAYKDFSEADGTVHGAYGPRLFGRTGAGQLHRVIEQLTSKPDTRKAVIQLFDARDLDAAYRDVPCTCTLQFLVRGSQLHLIAHMRSNDLFTGFPHDLFAFTMLQELVARSLDVPMGSYTHMVGSLHVYARDLRKAKVFLSEGYQELQGVMPEMPAGDPWPDVAAFVASERDSRSGSLATAPRPMSGYWRDLHVLLRAFELRDDLAALEGLRGHLNNPAYWPYIRARIDRVRASVSGEEPER